jgi:hypothetical protein
VSVRARNRNGAKFGTPHFVPLLLASLGFYEAEFVKTRCENSFFLFLIHFGRRLATTHRLGFGA